MKTILSVGVLALGLLGCAAPVKVAWVDRPDVHATPISSYSLRTANAPEPEVARLVRAALASRGFHEAANGETAQLFLSIESGIGAPRMTLRSSSIAPGYHSKGYVTLLLPSTDNTRMVSTPVAYDESSMSPPPGSFPTTDSVGVNTRTLSTSQTYSDRYASIPGLFPGTDPVVVREHFLRIAAYDGRGATTQRPESEIWSVRASVQDQSDDLRPNLPTLISAATDAIGKTARTEVKRP